MFGHPEYDLDGTGSQISVSGPNEEFLKSAFGIWLGKKFHMDFVEQ